MSQLAETILVLLHKLFPRRLALGQRVLHLASPAAGWIQTFRPFAREGS